MKLLKALYFCKISCPMPLKHHWWYTCSWDHTELWSGHTFHESLIREVWLGLRILLDRIDSKFSQICLKSNSIGISLWYRIDLLRKKCENVLHLPALGWIQCQLQHIWLHADQNLHYLEIINLKAIEGVFTCTTAGASEVSWCWSIWGMRSSKKMLEHFAASKLG